MAIDAPLPTDSPTRQITVAEVMRPATTSVETQAHLAAAAYLMKRSSESALIVTTDDEARRPVAIVTDTDIAQAVADGRNLEESRISDLRTAAPVTVAADSLMDDAARTMLRLRIHHLPVVDAGRLVGIIDISDACRALLGRGAGTSS